MSKKQFTTRGSFEVEEHLDLDRCHREPIHQTALIQPHGTLLQIDPDSREVLSASRNSDLYLDHAATDLLGEKLETLFDPELVEKIATRLPRSGPTTKRFVTDSDASVSLFPVGETAGIEYEPQPHPERSAEELITGASDLIGGVRERDTEDELFEHAVRATRAVSGYDRVMLYRFDARGNGAVVAEDKREDLGSYLGQHFPSSDIPEPARRLYRKNPLRYIPKVDYEPVPIIGPRGTREREELDLTHSSLRNVPLVHRQYLNNMEVGASLSVSLMVDGELWGLIACHAVDPAPLNRMRRDVCGMIGQAVSQRIGRIESDRREQHLEELERFHRAISGRVSDYVPLFNQLEEHGDALLDLLDASAFHLQIGDQRLLIGSLEGGVLEELRGPIQERLKQQDLVQVRSIVDEIDESWQYSDRVSGFLAARMGPTPRSFCVWFRPESRQTIRWGGDPRNPVQIDEEGRLSPRSSFEEWTQIMEAQSRRWTELDRITAREFIRTINQLALEVQSNLLEKANRNKETLMQELHHRVKNNFQLSASLLGLQKREIEDEKLRRVLEDVRARLQSMASLHHTLYQHEAVDEVQMKPYFDEIIDAVEDSFQQDEQPIRVERDIAEFSLPSRKAILCGLILSELLTNAFEHGVSGQTGGKIHVRLESKREQVVLSVADNGPGWDGGLDDLTSESLGLRLVRSLATDQLNGRFEGEGAGGSRFDVRFPPDP